MKSYRSKGLLSALCLSLGLAVGPALADSGLRVQLNQITAKADTASSLTLEFRLTNESAEPVHVDPWHTPIDGLYTNQFQVLRDGQPLPYQGPTVKRAAPTAGEFITLDPGTSNTVQFDLSRYYDMTQPGDYRVTYRGRVAFVKAAQGLSAKSVASPATTKLESSPLEVGVAPAADMQKAVQESLAPPSPLGANPKYVGCSNSQQSTLKTALRNSRSISVEAYKALKKLPPVDNRYTTWFGAYKDTRLTKVTDNFKNISSALNTKTVTFDCSSCTEKNWYAYVYPNQPYTIYLCGAFWSAPASGTDSQAGTLVHEMSHFTVVAGTDDIAYGQTACKKLAKDDPDDAIKNADSYEYYAEN